MFLFVLSLMPHWGQREKTGLLFVCCAKVASLNRANENIEVPAEGGKRRALRKS